MPQILTGGEFLSASRGMHNARIRRISAAQAIEKQYKL